ncbi:MAG: sulfite exporter TauE/SafE family protein [Clostridia bacterium]
MTAVIYTAVIFAATFLGAFVGLGGGVVIKPVLDAIGLDPVDTVSFLSSVAVFSMSISSTAQHIIKKTPFQTRIILLLSAGSAAGGLLGDLLFRTLLEHFDGNLVKGIQSLLLGCLLAAVLVYLNGRSRRFSVENGVGILAIGLALGVVSSFLGVGGGPINVAVLVLFFGFSMRDSAVYSVAVIFFAQLAKLITIYAGNRFAPYDLKILIFIIPAAVVGGLLGARLNRRCDEKRIRHVFTACVGAVTLLNFYNAATALIF